MRLISLARSVPYLLHILHSTSAEIAEKTEKKFKTHKLKVLEIITSSESLLLDNFSNNVLACYGQTLLASLIFQIR